MFLSSLSDTLRSLDTPVKIQLEAACLLGAYLRASRVAYVEVEPDGRILVQGHYVDGVPEMDGELFIADFVPEDWLPKFQAGRALVAQDAENDPRLSNSQQAVYDRLSIRAQLILPFTRDDRVAGALLVQQSQPRGWKDEEVSLVEEAAERTRTAIERAWAEGRLRDSERRYRILSNAVPSIVWTSTPSGRLLYVNDRWYDFTGQPRRQEMPLWSDLKLHPEDAPNFFKG